VGDEMQRLGLALLFAGLFAIPAQAENWVAAHKSLYVDTDSMFVDADGYTRFKTRELDSKNSVMHQHKEAMHCGRKQHSFRQMYGANAAVNNRDDSDVEKSSWADWRKNAREVYDIERLYALMTFVCTKAKK
jgi:hypothetical protein